MQVGDSSALALWLVQLSRLQALQLAGCMLASPRGYQWLLPGSGLPNSLVEVRLLLWPPPSPRFDATGARLWFVLLCSEAPCFWQELPFCI